MFLLRRMLNNVENDLPDDSRAFSKRSMGGHQTNTSTHSEHEETIFNGGSTHSCHKTFKQHNNAQGFYVSNDDSENKSECHFKRRKIRSNHMYYDETNSYPLDVDVFFADVPTSTQPMELDGEEVIFFFH